MAEGTQFIGDELPMFDGINGGHVYFRHLGIKKDIGKAKKGIRSKRITRGSQEVRNRAPCGRTVSSCDLTCLWERFGMHSANTRVTAARSHRATVRVQSQSYIIVHRATARCTARYRLAKSKLRLKLEFQVSKPGPSLFEGGGTETQGTNSH
ncbi:hypothetical protein PIB30_075109 [Stylosanthes scabra]|uniref:Uncharacterized protein n=1 Tax=Stylosanthes scabra TaxID=79078 RepID=A0ABU6VNX8_9FABA|nr:hypothetical protein [Stylosanthes scabra]